MLARDVTPSESTLHMLVDWHLLGKDAKTAVTLYTMAMLKHNYVGNLPLYAKRLVGLGETEGAFQVIKLVALVTVRTHTTTHLNLPLCT
jgi:hypothetical protein